MEDTATTLIQPPDVTDPQVFARLERTCIELEFELFLMGKRPEGSYEIIAIRRSRLRSVLVFIKAASALAKLLGAEC